MKKQQQRRQAKRKTAPVIFQDTPIGEFFRALAVVGINMFANALSQLGQEKRPQDQELKFCDRCQVHYTDRCNCKPKLLPQADSK